MNALPDPPLQRSDLAVLAELSEAFAVTLDVELTLSQAVARIARHMQAEAASVFMLDADGSTLSCRACEGPVDVMGLSVPVGRGIVGRTFSNNRPELVSDTREDAEFFSIIDHSTGFRTRSVVCAPLSTATGVIGVLQVLNKCGDMLFDEHDLIVLRVLAAPTALALSNATMAAQLVEQNRIRRELELARRMQRSLLPVRPRGCWPVLGVNVPAREISGDFYDYFEHPDGRIGFTIGDVSGKGLDASLLMVRTASLLRWAGKDCLSPSQWLTRVNEELCESISGGMFVCAVVGIYDPRSTRVVWASAGFPPALVRDADGRSQTLLADGPPLGMLPGLSYSQREQVLGQGSLYFFSDGVTDVRDGEGNSLGVEGACQLVERMADLPPQRRLRHILRHLRAMKLQDDTTMLLIESRTGPRKCLFNMQLSSDPARLREMRTGLQAALRTQPVDEETADRLVLAVHEACCNIIRHGYQGCTAGRIALNLDRCADALEFRLSDDAPAVDPQTIRPRDLGECRPGGLGINFIDDTMDAWGFSSPPGTAGNCLWMLKRVPSEHECTGDEEQ